jgi:hypothetical protein
MAKIEEVGNVALLLGAAIRIREARERLWCVTGAVMPKDLMRKVNDLVMLSGEVIEQVEGLKRVIELMETNGTELAVDEDWQGEERV